MPSFDKNLYKSKALTIEGEGVVWGFYYENVCDFIDVENENYAEKLECPTTPYEINPYTLCRNTGIKAGDVYLYEGDMVEYKSAISGVEIGYIAWDDYQGHFSICTSLNYAGRKPIRGKKINVIGNIVLSATDYGRMQAYSDSQDGTTSTDAKVECRSQQKLNRITKQFLPK